MHPYFQSIILEKTGASAILHKQVIQELWSGYGEIVRLTLKNASVNSIVVKHVRMPGTVQHPRGWNTDLSHRRKMKSYNVESTWYEVYSQYSKARIPQCISIETKNDEVLLIMEDLDASGFHLRKNKVSWKEISKCLAWLAKFHASYLGMTPKGLWEVGSYWHLATRPQELAALDDIGLKEAAPLIDTKLNQCEYQTFIHGDAKLANFCFSESGEVAGVDFQYVGGGCGMKDVAYFIGSCLGENECERMEEEILDTYFEFLQRELTEKNPSLEMEWRSLYRMAWADFHRFLKGWSPGHWKINSYSERITKEVIKDL